MKNKNQLKIGAILSYIIIIVNMIIGIIYTPILTAKLGQSEYGLYSLVTTVISYLTILDFGFGNAIIIYTARYRANNDKDKEEKLHGMFLIVYMFLGVIAGFIGIALFCNVEKMFGTSMTIEEIKKAKVLMSILTFNLVITFPLSIFSSIITAYEEFIFSKTLNLIRIIINPIIMLVLLNVGYKSIALVILNTVLNISVLILNYLYCKYKIKIKLKFGKIDFKVLKEIMLYSIWLFLNSIIDRIENNVDQFVLGIVNGTAAVAIYSVANQLNQMYLNFSTAISGVMLPKVAKMEENKASDMEFTEVFIKTGRLQFIVIALIMSGFILYGQEFINLMWVGKDYSESYIIACILMIPVTVPLIQNVGLNILQAKNQYKFRVMILFGFAILNLIATVFLSKIWSGIGAAIATAISMILGKTITMNIFYYKKTHIDIPLFWKNILQMLVYVIIIMGVGIIIKLINPIDSIINLLMQIGIYIIIYSFVMWNFALNQYEKNLVSKPLKKIIK